jgi:hypothetical protein
LRETTIIFSLFTSKAFSLLCLGSFGYEWGELFGVPEDFFTFYKYQLDVKVGSFQNVLLMSEIFHQVNLSIQKSRGMSQLFTKSLLAGGVLNIYYFF